MAAEAQHTGRIVILGAGIAALTAALRLAPCPVLVISPAPLGQGAASALAQGGVAAALGAGDSVAAHVADTLEAGAGIVDGLMAGIVAEAAPGCVAALAAGGVAFDRTPAGDYALSQEAAHSQPRVARVEGDRTGAAILSALIAAVRQAPSVQVVEGLAAERLEVTAGRVTGVWLGQPGRVARLIRAPAILLASGGAAGLYTVTTNPGHIRGQGLGMAARAGAAVADAEFVQFHPTALHVGGDPAPLLTEALRGEGARLVNRLGVPFMAGQHKAAELAPRDIVARAVYAQSQAGLAPALDARAIFAPGGPAHFPTVSAACARAGLDPARDLLPVAAAAHYHMGGVACDAQGRSSLPGLWVAGEVASTGLHGANRLASNGLLEAMVMAGRAAQDIAAERAWSPEPELAVPPLPPAAALPDEAPLIRRLRALMTEGCGVIRDGSGLRHALDALRALDQQAQTDSAKNMVAAATLIAAAALLRCESRGGHFRADHPQPDPELARRSRLFLADALALRDEKVPADVA
ncbi:MAG: L-aspartate oxidase [Gemmobacter sp.]|nr:L-aspartate oxidase [Gemmobacter sp.]MBL8563165.1 L-aspartate oxidase [Gemmobacter sp.]